MKRLPWGAVATLTGEGLARVGMSLFQFLVANALGPTQYGALGLVLSYASVLVPLADLGLNALVLRHLANNPDPQAMRAPMALKLTATIAYLVLLLATAAVRGTFDLGSLTLVLAGAFFAFTSLSDFLRQALRAKENSLHEFHARLVFLVLFLISCAAFAWFKPGIPGTLLAYVLPMLGLCLAYLQPLSRVFARLSPDWRQGWDLLFRERRFLVQALVYLFLVNVSSRMDLWLLDWGSGHATVGAYFAAYNLIFSGIFFAQALSSHMYPRLHRPNSGWGELRRALWAHLGLALVFWLGVSVFGKLVFSLIYRQAGFAPGQILLSGMGILLALSVLNYLWLTLVIGRNAQWISALALVFTIAVKFVLGRQWVISQGALGMLHASLWAEIPACLGCGAAACWIYLRRRQTASDKA